MKAPAAWPLLVVLALSAIWLPALTWGFAADDFYLVPIDWPRFAANPFLINARPVEMLFFALLPDQAFVHHAANLLLYVACLLVMWRFCRLLALDAWSTFFALSAFFHPAFLWSATWIAQRNDLLVIGLVVAALAAARTPAQLALMAAASGAKTPFIFQNIVFAARYAARRRWMASALALLCFVAFVLAGYLTHYARAESWPTLASAEIPLAASLPLRGAKLLEGVSFVFAPIPMFAVTWWGPVAAFAAYLTLWAVVARSLDRARLTASPAGWLLALAVAMAVPFVYASDVRLTAHAAVFTFLAVASMTRWRRTARLAVVGILALNLTGIGLNYRTFDSGTYDIRAPLVEKDLSQPVYRYQGWREEMRQRILAALGLPTRPRAVQ